MRPVNSGLCTVRRLEKFGNADLIGLGKILPFVANFVYQKHFIEFLKKRKSFFKNKNFGAFGDDVKNIEDLVLKKKDYVTVLLPFSTFLTPSYEFYCMRVLQ